AQEGRIVQRHHAIQRMLRRHDVTIPFAERLAELIEEERVEARRAFPHLLSMIQASTLLHQLRRSADTQGRLIATRHDYQLARKRRLGPLSRLLGSCLSKACERFRQRMEEAFGKDKSFTTTEAKLKEKHSRPAVINWLRELEQQGHAVIVEEG